MLIKYYDHNLKEMSNIEREDYRKILESAPALDVPTLEEKFKKLADYGGTVLAGRETQYGFEFVTWDWDFNRRGVNHGHYYHDALDSAAEDFAVRSGLVDGNRLFSEDQMEEIYRCCEDTLCETYELDEKQRKIIEGVQEQIRIAIPDIVEQIQEHDRQAFEQEQGQTM